MLPAYRLGGLDEGELGSMARAPAQRSFRLDKHRALSDRCRACAHLPLCHGGCPKDRFLSHGSRDDGRRDPPGAVDPARPISYLCPAYEAFFSHAAPALRRMADALRAGRPAAQAVASTAPSRRGRHAPCPCGSGRKARRCCGVTG